jgi:cytochrome c biogenesis protein CcmG/thiol:disulfide interchange protein DsbE
MKHLYLALVFLVGMSSNFQAQTLPAVDLKDLIGTTINTADLAGNGTPTIICFWATWCSPCKRELNNYMDYYADWQDETGVNLIAVSVDDSRSTSRVAPVVMNSGWDFQVLLDPNKDFSRAMQVINVPHTFLYNGEGELVWSHNNYADGDEEELYEELLKLVE